MHARTHARTQTHIFILVQERAVAKQEWSLEEIGVRKVSFLSFFAQFLIFNLSSGPVCTAGPFPSSTNCTEKVA